MMSSTRVSKKWVTNTLSEMTQFQVNTLSLFEHHKKWTAPLLAMKEQVDLSTAHRRLSPLCDLELIARQSVGYRSTGGRFPDLFYLTRRGAAVLNRALYQAEHQIKAPSIANSISNEHDLLVLETAIRLKSWHSLRHRQKTTLDIPRAVNDQWTEFEPVGEQVSLVPDLYIHDVKHQSHLYFEIEQTVRYQHILTKYQIYRKVNSCYRTSDQYFYLWVLFANERQQQALTPDHVRAYEQVGLSWDEVYLSNLETIREYNIHSLDDLWTHLA